MKQKGQICINYGKTNNNYNKRGNIIAKIILHSYSKRNITATFSQAYISLFFKQKWPIIMLSLVIRVAVIYHHSLFCKSKSKSELRNERENLGGHSYFVRSKNGECGKRGGWGVLIYKSVSDPTVTIVQPRHMNFKGRATINGSNFFIVRFTRLKNFSFNFLVFQKITKKKT